MSARLSVVDLGRRPYAEVLELQRALCRERMAGERHEDLLLLVEHEPVVTLGRGTRATSLPLAPAELERRGLEVAEVERGGDVTYHGPGQLVGYPVLDLREHREDLHWYLRQLEAGLIAALGTLGVPAERAPGLTGVWTRGRKIASLGIHVKQWVTFHGFALNVSTDLRAFELIVPCGIDGVVMTSVAAELGRGDAAALWEETREAVVTAFGQTFGYEAVGRVTAGSVADVGAARQYGGVIPSAARDLAREWLEDRGEGPSLRSG
jgi:lipoate-protein ligase B